MSEEHAAQLGCRWRKRGSPWAVKGGQFQLLKPDISRLTLLFLLSATGRTFGRFLGCRSNRRGPRRSAAAWYRSRCDRRSASGCGSRCFRDGLLGRGCR